MAEKIDLTVGEIWAYRARQVDDVVAVEVLRIGNQQPPRVFIRFVDDVFEGRQEWVPPARLKVRWTGVDAYREGEARWDRVFALAPPTDDPGERAADQVFEMLIDAGISRMEFREGGACRITDPVRLAELTGLPHETWMERPETFRQGSDVVVPWPVTEKIAAAAARRNPGPVLDAIENEESRERYYAIHGRVYRGRGANPDDVISPEICRAVDNEHGRPRRAILRSWCGTDAVARYDELAELRKEIHRVGQIAEEAIGILRRAGRKHEADDLTLRLGTPVEMLRHTES